MSKLVKPEQRIISEAALAARRAEDLPLAYARDLNGIATDGTAFGENTRHRAYKRGFAAALTLKLFKQLCIVCRVIMTLSGVPRRIDPRFSVKRIDRKSGIVSYRNKSGKIRRRARL